jgi:hypothetical protein
LRVPAWTSAWDDFAINSPGAVQDGVGACITQATNLPTQGIAVIAGTYGGNCGAARGNDSWWLNKVCQSQDRCEYVVDYTVIGDPVPGCGKDYVAEWVCLGSGGFPFIRRATATPEAGFGKTVTLTCP